MKNPIIGITLDYENNGGYSKFPWYAIRENYLSCLNKFGAIPFPLFHQNSANDYFLKTLDGLVITCLLYTSPSPRDRTRSRMPSSA